MKKMKNLINFGFSFFLKYDRIYYTNFENYLKIIRKYKGGIMKKSKKFLLSFLALNSMFTAYSAGKTVDNTK